MDRRRFVEIIEAIAPPRAGASWDNSGIQIQVHDDCNRILVALEINHRIIDEAVANQADWILTHHPLFLPAFKSIDRWRAADPTDHYAIRCIQENINVYSTHIPFDNAPEGNNGYLGRLLGLEDVHRPSHLEETIPFMVGNLSSPMILEDFLSLLEKRLDLSPGEITVVEGRAERIQKIGMTTGAGSDFFPYALEEGCQLFLTGEARYHDSLKAKEMGIHMVGAGHHGTEKIFIPNMAGQLKQRAPSLTVLESIESTNPYMI